MVSVVRKEELKKIIIEKKAVTVVEMAKIFSVSQETIRRDLAVLEREGFVNKSYGGASLIRRVGSEVSQKEKQNLFVEKKHHIAEQAASFISPNDCIFLDSSTTVLSICQTLEDIPLTVVTNSLSVANALSGKKNIHLVLTGGSFDTNTQSFLGSETISYLSKHFFDKAFFSCRCIDSTKGICDSYESVADVHRLLIENSHETFLLADSNKLGRTAFVEVCPINKISYFITDKPLSKEWDVVFSKAETRVIISEPIESTNIH